LKIASIPIRGNIGDALDRLHALGDDRRPLLQPIEIGVRQRELVVGVALASAGAHVLGCEHEQADVGNAGNLPAQPVDHRGGRYAAPSFRRLQADEHGTPVRGAAAGTTRTGADLGADLGGT
jgi:hypothetical protein